MQLKSKIKITKKKRGRWKKEADKEVENEAKKESEKAIKKKRPGASKGGRKQQCRVAQESQTERQLADAGAADASIAKVCSLSRVRVIL
jgi:hypothetical protein